MIATEITAGMPVWCFVKVDLGAAWPPRRTHLTYTTEWVAGVSQDNPNPKARTCMVMIDRFGTDYGRLVRVKLELMRRRDPSLRGKDKPQ